MGAGQSKKLEELPRSVSLMLYSERLGITGLVDKSYFYFGVENICDQVLFFSAQKRTPDRRLGLRRF